MMHPQYYHPIFIYTILIYTLFQTSVIKSQSNKNLLYGNHSSSFSLLFCIILALFIGLRPISGRYFGDMGTYSRLYVLLSDYGYVPSELNIEIGFAMLMYFCSRVMVVSGFFCVVSFTYFLSLFVACKRFFKGKATWAMLFFLGAFTCWGSAVNGLRNGVACAILVLAYSFLRENSKNKIVPILLAVLAYSMHKSTILPILCTIVSLYYSDTKKIIYFWILSIVISLVGGSSVANIFVGLGFDDRLDSYLQDTNDLSHQFSSTGFRFDFLLYSVVPIILGYYVVVKRKIYDFHYKLLLNTYILANSFWVMVITSSFSNRFAYLSWFLYPLILAYPLLKFEIWSHQSKKLAIFMLGNILFTYLMFLMGK